MDEEVLVRSFREFAQRHRLIERGERLIVAASGGIDSMVLLDVLRRIGPEMKLMLAVAHFNHQLRGVESDEDEAFVRGVARQHKLECYVERAETDAVAEAQKTSIQEAARELRYAFFSKLRKSLGYQKIVTAHHADDSAETVIFNLLRGAGVHGLSGIPVLRKDLCVIRPMLFAAREEIREYAKSAGVAYREDSSNETTDYTRNFLRRELLPMIRENVNPNLSRTLRRTSEVFNELEEYLALEVEKVLPGVMARRTPEEAAVDLRGLRALPPFVQEYLLLRVAREFVGADVEFTTVRTIMNISSADTGASCSVGRGVTLFRDRDHLVFLRGGRSVPYRYPIELEQGYDFDAFSFRSAAVSSATLSDDPNVEFIDGARLGSSLVLRSWHDGDWFIPLGMKDRKKVSDFFIDQKVALHEKHSVPLLTSGEEIVWVCGRRLDDRFKVTPQTTNILKLEFLPRHQRT